MKKKSLVERIIEDTSCRTQHHKYAYNNQSDGSNNSRDDGREILLDDVTELLKEISCLLTKFRFKQ